MPDRGSTQTVGRFMTDFAPDLVEFAQNAMFAPPLRHPVYRAVAQISRFWRNMRGTVRHFGHSGDTIENIWRWKSILS